MCSSDPWGPRSARSGRSQPPRRPPRGQRGSPSLGMQPGALPFPRKELSPREALAEGIVNLYQSEGKQYAIPKDIDTIALWYNKTIFDEMGVAYPDDTWTWDDFADAAAKLTNEEHWGYAIAPSNNQDSFYNVVYSMGGNIISDDKKKSGYDDPATIKAMTLITDMVKAGYCPDLNTISENGADVLFQSGKAAMVTQGSWMLATSSSPIFKFALLISLI